MATLSVIRRWALREQMSIREIARRTGLSRNTVKKYLRAGEEAPRYAKRASSSKLDPYAEKLATCSRSRPPNRGNSGAICGRSTQPQPKKENTKHLSTS